MVYNNLQHNHKQNYDKTMLKSYEFQTLSEIFKQLSDFNRIKIFLLLCHCEECVINISSMVEMSSPAVSHHLKQLKAYGLINSRRKGKEVYYKVADTKKTKILHEMIESLDEIICPLNSVSKKR
ncbi:ArsR family transcriptional regulator [Clostridioides difficile]|nr:ArsR family transcriptional regulator [Clostridioides difficile]